MRTTSSCLAWKACSTLDACNSSANTRTSGSIGILASVRNVAGLQSCEIRNGVLVALAPPDVQAKIARHLEGKAPDAVTYVADFDVELASAAAIGDRFVTALATGPPQ